VRAALGAAATGLATAVGYTNLGTVEFLVEDGNAYFLEMNTRIQVEHPVTELVSAVDLVAEQFRIADGRALSFGVADVAPRGAAIEIRLNAETTAGGAFLPAPGTLRRLDLPAGPGVRVDTGFRAGDELLPHYDNLIAKIAVWGEDRDAARRNALGALGELVVEGVPTTADAARTILAHDDFRDVRHSTRWLGERGGELFPAAPIADVVEPADRPEPAAGDRSDVEVLGRWYRIPRFLGDPADGGRTDPPPVGGGASSRRPTRRGASRGARRGTGMIVAPMQGTVTAIDVVVGDAVTADVRVLVLEAMKMENNVLAGVDGVVRAVHAAAGATVAPGTLLVEVDVSGDAGKDESDG
jgi:acetyl-CoA/propionyl-CoA/long-chain acyl-CoA carboxylase, biotin carboxylase, biotin carboxyl carrier protein